MRIFETPFSNATREIRVGEDVYACHDGDRGRALVEAPAEVGEAQGWVRRSDVEAQIKAHRQQRAADAEARARDAEEAAKAEAERLVLEERLAAEERARADAAARAEHGEADTLQSSDVDELVLDPPADAAPAEEPAPERAPARSRRR
jgi:hypothetical protein